MRGWSAHGTNEQAARESPRDGSELARWLARRQAREPLQPRGQAQEGGLPPTRHQPLVGPPDLLGFLGQNLSAVRAVPLAPDHARLRVQLHWPGVLGRVLPATHHCGHAVCGRRERRPLLDGHGRGHAPVLCGQLRRAHVPGLGHRRDGLVLRLPGQPHCDLRCHGAYRPSVLPHPRLRRRHDGHRVRRDGIPLLRRAGRRLRGQAAAEGQAVPGRHLSGGPLRALVCGLHGAALYHAQHGGREHWHGCGRSGVVCAAHAAAGAHGDRALAAAHVARSEGDLCQLLPAVPGGVSLQPHRLDAQVCHRGRALVRQPALLQCHVLPRARHSHGRSHDLQAAAAAPGQHLGRPRAAQAL